MRQTFGSFARLECLRSAGQLAGRYPHLSRPLYHPIDQLRLPLKFTSSYVISNFRDEPAYAGFDDPDAVFGVLLTDLWGCGFAAARDDQRHFYRVLKCPTP